MTDDSATVVEDSPVSSRRRSCGNDSDVDGDTLTIASVTSGTGGTAVLNANGTVTFTPNANFHGAASFTYTVSDGTATSNAATVTINVAAVNHAPVANADTLAATEDTPVSYTAAQLIGNDSDVDGDTLTIASVTSGTGGTAVLNANGTVTFTPNANFHGAASFTYTVSDGTATSNAATVTINVAAVNHAPVANADTLAATEDTPVSYTAAQLVGNDSDVDGDTLTIASVTSGTGGTAVLNANGTVTFTPNANFHGAASFTYTVSDGTATSNAATVTINVAAVNPVLSAIISPAAVSELADALAQSISIQSSLTVIDPVIGKTLTASVIGGPVVKLDGVLFTLPTGDSNGLQDSFIKNIQTGEVSLVAGSATGSPLLGNASTADAIFSPDGSKIAFISVASNLVAGDTNGGWDVFVKDLATDTITRVSTTSTGQQTTGGQSLPQFGLAWSPDGTKLAFGSFATNLAPGAIDANNDIFVKDVVNSAGQVISNGAIQQITISAGAEADGNSNYPHFSPGGTKVVFQSTATNLVAGDTNGNSDIFIKYIVAADGHLAGDVVRISTDSAGGQGTGGDSTNAVFSPDGTKVAFSSTGTFSGLDADFRRRYLCEVSRRCRRPFGRRPHSSFEDHCRGRFRRVGPRSRLLTGRKQDRILLERQLRNWR